MTALIGIAADQGLLELDRPLVSFFPGHTIANLDSRKLLIPVRIDFNDSRVVVMSMVMQWTQVVWSFSLEKSISAGIRWIG